MKGKLKREVFSCEELSECDFPRAKPRMELWWIVPKDEKSIREDEAIYLGLTS